ncbi:cytoplasmic phosphatidylinositol transfer protein 1 isoform X2 [Macrotis lagotis]|uniref:cytoplasmic phosphatidylinositol transfer protein 1 isoform X2 n=1 Tax=Macrotis lagotis TaxID=92651 RepID=UPI003D6972DD
MLQRRLGTITLTQSQCSFLPKFSIHIETKYEDNKGSNNSIFDSEAKDVEREVCFIDIACDEIPERYYKESEVVRDILLIGHRQAFAWVDEWYDMTMDEVREFERATQEATNKKIGVFSPSISISSISLLPSAIRTAPSSAPSTPLSTDPPEFLAVPKDRPRKKSAPETLTLPDPEKKSTLDLPGVHSSDKPCPPQE